MTAHMLESAHPARGRREPGNATPAAGRSVPATRLWRRWAPSAESAEHVSTCLAPFARVPGILPGIWGVMVTLGMAVALTLQALVIAGTHLRREGISVLRARMPSNHAVCPFVACCSFANLLFMIVLLTIVLWFLTIR